MRFVEKTYAEQLHWLFELLKRESIVGRDRVDFHLNNSPLRHDPEHQLPVLTPPIINAWANGPDWKKIQKYLQKLGYSVVNGRNNATVSIDWSNPRRLHE